VTITRYQYTNFIDSASLELDENALVISYEEFHPFGSTAYQLHTNNSQVSLKRYRYVHKERDEETGLYYYGARYHCGWLCRFVSVDPLKDKFPFYSTYQYAGNRPIVGIDKDGLELENKVDPGVENGSQGGGGTTNYPWSNGSQSSQGMPAGTFTKTLDLPHSAPASETSPGGYGDGPIIARSDWYGENAWMHPTLAGMINGGAESLGSAVDLATFLPKYATDSEFRNEVNAVMDYIANNPEAVIDQMGKDLNEWSARLGDSQGLTYSGREEAYAGGVLLFDVLTTILSAGAGAYLKSMKAGTTGARSADVAAKGAIRYADDGDDFITFVANTPQPEGMLDVALHGGKTFVELKKGQSINHRLLGNLIQNNPQFTGQPIRLISCYTGCLPDGFAKNLSNKLGVDVWAPNDLIWARPSGRLSIGPDQYTNSGRFIKFTPGENIKK